MATHSQPYDGSDRSDPAGGQERLSGRTDLHDHHFRADSLRHARAQPPALSPLVGAAADRFPAALQQSPSRGHDELFVWHRACAVGARDLGGVARARAAAASGGVDAVRAAAVLLPPLRRRRSWTGAPRIRFATALCLAMA